MSTAFRAVPYRHSLRIQGTMRIAGRTIPDAVENSMGKEGSGSNRDRYYHYWVATGCSSSTDLQSIKKYTGEK
jgi:hypothetical protein